MTLPSSLSQLGQLVYLQSVQTNMHIYALITDGSTPNLNTITIEVNADESTAVVPGLIGKPGPAGQPQFALDLQPEVFQSPAALPQNLTTANFGQYWLIEQPDQFGNIVSSAAYVWWNTFYRVVPFGTQGPVGPVPVINPDIVVIDADMNSYVQNTGTVANPSWTFYLALPVGKTGPIGTINQAEDFNNTTQPTIGQVIGFNGIYSGGLPQYQPMTVGAMNPLPYTVPESSFTSYTGVSGTTQIICTFPVPPNPWPWKPIVFGQIQVTGINLSLNPLLVGVEVLLGDPASGTLVATGFGNDFGGAVTILPQTSSTASASTAMSPTNSTALVPANHTGNKGTLYVNLVNEGMAAVYDFTAANAQLFVLAVPIGGEGAVNAGIYGTFAPKFTLKAWSVALG